MVDVLSILTSQFGGDGLGTILWIVMFFVFMFVYPRLMISQVLFKLESTAVSLENMTQTAKRIVTKKVSKNPSREVREAINNFMEFFVIEPVSLDPFGVMKKIEHLTKLSEKRFKHFVRNLVPSYDSEIRADLMMGMSGAISLHHISKQVRHFVELVRKTRNLQLAMILQMQLPFIERVSKALLRGTEALTNGWPIGDSVGPYVVQHMIDRYKEADEDTLVAAKRIKGKKVIFVRAKGPGGRTGNLGEVVEKISKRTKVAKIITIDAASKFEGEKTGSIAQWVGVAIGGGGVDRSYIENLATQSDIPLDAFVVKMAPEEAIMPMAKDVFTASAKVVKMVQENISETREKGTIVVVGVGNCSGIDNNSKKLKESEERIKKATEVYKHQQEEDKVKKKKWTDYLGFGFGGM